MATITGYQHYEEPGSNNISLILSFEQNNYGSRKVTYTEYAYIKNNGNSSITLNSGSLSIPTDDSGSVTNYVLTLNDSNAVTIAAGDTDLIWSAQITRNNNTQNFIPMQMFISCTLGNGGTSFFPYEEDKDKGWCYANAGAYLYGSSLVKNIPCCTKEGYVEIGDTVHLHIGKGSGNYTSTVILMCAHGSGLTDETIFKKTVIEKTAESDITFQIPDSFKYCEPSRNYNSVFIRVYSYDGDTLINSDGNDYYQDRIFAMLPDSIVPVNTASVSRTKTYSASDIGEYLTAVTGLNLSLSAEPSTGSTISKYTVDITDPNGSITSKDYTSAISNAEIISLFSISGNYSIKCTSSDARGRTAVTTFNITVYDYSSPVIGVEEAYRCLTTGTASNEGTYFAFTAAGSCSSCNGKNSIQTRTYKYTVQGDTTVINEGTWTDGNKTVAGAGQIELDKAYTVTLSVTDKISSASISCDIQSSYVTMDFLAGGKGAAFGKVAETENLLDVAWDAKFAGKINGHNILDWTHPVGSVYYTLANVTQPEANPETFFGGKWMRINGRFLLAAGPNEANTADNWGTESYNHMNMPEHETGGEFQHTLTVDEIPSHNHGIYAGFGDTSPGTDAYRYQYWGANNLAWHSEAGHGTGYTGGGGYHNQIPPYLSVLAFERLPDEPAWASMRVVAGGATICNVGGRIFYKKYVGEAICMIISYMDGTTNWRGPVLMSKLSKEATYIYSSEGYQLDGTTSTIYTVVIDGETWYLNGFAYYMGADDSLKTYPQLYFGRIAADHIPTYMLRTYQAGHIVTYCDVVLPS